MENRSPCTIRTEVLKQPYNEDLDLTHRLGIHSLPSYLVQYKDKALLMQSFDYQDFSDAIKKMMQ